MLSTVSPRNIAGSNYDKRSIVNTAGERNVSEHLFEDFCDIQLPTEFGDHISMKNVSWFHGVVLYMMYIFYIVKVLFVLFLILETLTLTISKMYIFVFGNMKLKHFLLCMSILFVTLPIWKKTGVAYYPSFCLLCGVRFGL